MFFLLSLVCSGQWALRAGSLCASRSSAKEERLLAEWAARSVGRAGPPSWDGGTLAGGHTGRQLGITSSPCRMRSGAVSIVEIEESSIQHPDKISRAFKNATLKTGLIVA